ncbi:hypothetical protein ACEWY4_020001 [Coilia grayii]|uniref:ZP domain-containing protein n=1 Tax=Coilia grayii TaxID=363190 RepID=A0ABD1JEG4_9TELE
MDLFLLFSIIYASTLSCGYSNVLSGDNLPTANPSSFVELILDERYSSGGQLPEQEPVLPGPYLLLPMFQHSRVPLLAKEHFSPLNGEGNEKLPNDIKEMLVPVFPPVKKSRHSGGPRGIVIRCEVNKMEVRVPKRLLGYAPFAHLTFGTCQPNNFTKHYMSFVYNVNECGSERSIVNNRVAYSNTLRYTPIVAMGPIKRVIPFTLPITCHFNRFHYSYKIGYKPKVETIKLYKPMTSKSVYTLTPFDAQWRKLNASDGYAIGRPMYFEAEGPPMDRHQRLYIHSCHVTANKSHTSKPRFTVIEKFGCMIDSKTSSQSRFISYTRNTIRFSVDAFVFQGVSNKHLFMHCDMSLGSVTPTESDKSCSYNHKTKRWEELHGFDSVCSCCESTCGSSPTGTNKMVSSGSWSVESEVVGAGEGISPAWAEGDEHEMTFPLWPEEEEQVPEAIQVVTVTESKPEPITSPAEVEKDIEPRRIFEEIFGFN